ncbi:MAG: nucleotidyltransferase family protein [Oscillospiraceae bacterium]|nr:nucleotidyltransferase family protein [Oscillospiraceae bacterium]
MRTVGIVAEYNPFHRGHLYHLERSRTLTEAEAVVCVLSGDFVQRGEPAVFSKFARAEAAVRAGADLVLELPLPWGIASAEGFARGAVGLLEATGVVDCLSFGSECGDVAALRELASVLERRETEEELLNVLRSGVSYAAARERAVAAAVGVERAALLRQPNNNLGVEYCRALRRLGSGMECVTVERADGGHGGENSASALRARLRAGESIGGLTPESCLPVWEREIREGRMVTMAALETALLSRLRMLPRAAFERLSDAGEGLYNLLYAQSRVGESWESVLAGCKSKRYPLARLRRALLSAALGVEKGMAEEEVPYIRPLCANERGCALLREMKKRAALPILSRGGDVRRTGGRAEAIFELGSRAHDLFVLGFSEVAHRRGDEDFHKTISIIYL